MQDTDIFLTQEIDKTNSRYFLWQLIPKNSIVVTPHILPLFGQISNLKSYLPCNADQTIYLDLSDNPEILNGQHILNVIDNLKKIAPLKVVVNEYAQFYKPQEDFIYYPLFFYSYSHQSFISPSKYYNQIGFPKFSKKTKSFMSLNNRPLWHRIWLFTELAKNKLLDKIEYSCVWDPKTNHYNELDQLPEYKQQEARSFLNLLPIRLSGEHNQDYNADTSVSLDCYCTCAVNIVTESSPNLGFLSEKICKPLACYQIPILLGPKGATQFCVDAGFDMFEDIIPWQTWDSIADNHQRCKTACEFVVDYIKHRDPIADWQRCQNRVINNHQRLVSDKFKKFCTSQFRL
jgi:hypothetical protein